MSRRFSPEPNTLSLFVARRNSGKTHLMRHLLREMARGGSFHWVRVVTPTAFNGEWAAVVGEAGVVDRFDEAYIDSILERQAATGGRSRGLLILDDCLGSANFQSALFTKIASAGRHYGLTVWASFQHYFKAPTVLRANADYLFVLGRPGERVAKALLDEYSPQGVFTEAAMRRYLLAATQDYGAVRVDNRRAGALGVVRAPRLISPFRLVST